MTKRITLIGVILFYFFPLLAFSQAADPCHFSTEGKDFWFGLMQNRSTLSPHYMEITVTSREGAQFTLTYGNEETLLGNYTVLPNASIPVPIDYNLLEAQGSESPENKGIHLVSTNPVNVYALNYRLQSSDVAVIYPTEALAKEYFAMCYTPNPTGGKETNSEFLIVATEDATQVKITPSVKTHLDKPAKVQFQITLNKGQSYQVQSMNTSVSGQGDLTGSFVSADKPIAFFSGSKATGIPSTGSYDHLYEQIPPTSTWGKEFYVVPLKLRSKDTYRVLAAEDGTIVKIEGTNTTKTLGKGDFYEFELTDACRIISNRKILLAQFCRSQAADESNGVGDPFMIIISPVVQQINDVTFVAYVSNLIKDIFYVNIIAKKSEVPNIELDGTLVNNSSLHFTDFQDGKYSYIQMPITSGTHRLRNVTGNGGFLAFVYGFGNKGSTESYGYGVGFNLDIQLDLGLNYVSNDTLVLCQGKEVKLEAEAYFNQYEWNTKETSSSIQVSKEGLYTLKATTDRGCQKSAYVFIKVSDPKIDLGTTFSSCGPGKVTLDAGKEVLNYKWQDGSTNQTFKMDKSGDYKVYGTNIFGCIASDSIRFDVFDVPEVEILGDTLNCGVFTSDLKVKITQADTALWNYNGAAIWSSIPAGIDFTNIKPDGATLKATKPGYYQINYLLKTKKDCYASDSYFVGFYDIPESDFEVISPESTDKCSSYGRIVKYTGKSGPTAKFKWDFGGLMVLDTLGTNEFKISIGANNPLRTIKLTVEEHNCTSYETVKKIGVDPKFRFWAENLQGCDSLCVNFFSEIAIIDTVSYQWDFGDGATSNLKNPVHCYQDTGKYDVSLMLTNEIDGCRNGSIEKQMIKIFKTPYPVISADSGICYDDTLNVEYLAVKPNSICTWSAKGNKLLSTNSSKAKYLLEEEISEVKFLVEENGCKCDTLKVQVKRKPNFDFSAKETKICLPFPVELTANSKDLNLLFNWSVDTVKNSTGKSIEHLFKREGYYDVNLVALSNLTACSDTVNKTRYIQVYPLPIPKYTQNYTIATIEHPEITFSNLSEKAMSFLWDFGDNTTSENRDPLHSYDKVGEYRIIMQATSEFGCIDTIGSAVKIIPFSLFVPNAFRPDSEVPENRIFIPIRYGIDPGKYQFQVLNRIGSVVFETQDANVGWNGKMANGTIYDPGVYVWIVKYTDIQGYDHAQKGTVMLVR